MVQISVHGMFRRGPTGRENDWVSFPRVSPWAILVPSLWEGGRQASEACKSDVRACQHYGFRLRQDGTPGIDRDMSTDKDGSLTILVPGTVWQKYGGWTPDSNGLFRCAELAGGGIGGCTKLLAWSPSGNNDRSGSKRCGRDAARGDCGASVWAGGTAECHHP